MPIAHKIELDPNNKQATYFAKAVGCARFAYNWALAEWDRQYEAWKNDHSLPKPSEAALRRQLNAIKRERYPWMLEVTKCAPQLAIKQLGTAFENFFAGRARHPKFHRKGVHDRFRISNDQFAVEGRRIRIPNLGWVRMREKLRFSGKLMSATVSRRGGRWFVSLCVDSEPILRRPAENQGEVGVDLGVKAFATLSTGEVLEGPKPLKAVLDRVRRLSRSLSRKKRYATKVTAADGSVRTVMRDSKNRAKAKKKLSRLYKRIADVRRDFLHKTTTELTRRFHTIVIEDLNVRGMMQNRHLARSIADMGFYEFRRQVEYKAAMRGGIVVEADRWYASSKTCSQCGHRMEKLPLEVRRWRCPCCGAVHDRDVNAARNLKNLAVSSTVSACGEVSSGCGDRKVRTVKLPRLK